MIAFALAEILVEGGERVGVPGLMRPTASRNVIDQHGPGHDPRHRPSAPACRRALLPRRCPKSCCCPISGVRSPISAIRSRRLSGAHARIHVVQIVDPAEETFPYSGRVEFLEPEGAGSITAGRAETWRNDYFDKLAAHRAAMREEADRVHASFIIHRTDRPASELVLALHARMGEGGDAPVVAAARRSRSGGARMIGGLPLAFRTAAGAARICSASRCCGGCCGLIPPRPRRIEFPAGAAAVRHRAEGRDAGAHALVADAAAAVRSRHS